MIVVQKRDNKEIEKLSQVLAPENFIGVELNRVTKKLQSQEEQKTLVDLRKFAYELEPDKTKSNAIKD